ncbi:MAG: hypothetical protein GTN67_05325 [Hydrotalea flava]|uniref:DUF5522 domain-containing protein n=1 Tax=Hydrotalea TaxID=1004300 RepID=UPI000943E158|nr:MULTISPECIES: DUF5522 domain-containing protein [Hydrotalea]MBY0347112.1 hypothetical protein [Hydrotalea flava]NIM34859.1 hypothetical protein [Hydrotalea flava]NIM37689.1 hypothetical protein [Hydrotalea flava]NIN02854.1 hypothetical protein [Hydrotalea flava]NIN14539.1 hypothetical protein [Hydrotalea flava]
MSLIEGTDFYYDVQGYMVLTEKYHLEKGYCCGYGCRHCPYQYENVPEPKRSALTEQAVASIKNASPEP